MTNNNGKPKTVTELREALEKLAEERAGYLAATVEAEAGLKESVRQLIDGDPEANERKKGFRMRRTTMRDAIEQLDMVVPDLERELAEAVAAEEQTARELDAEQAKEFAAGLPNLFRECDRCFAEFHRSFAAAIAAVNTGRLRGWNLPSQELFQSKLMCAVRTQLSIGELRMLDLSPMSPTLRCTFESLGQAYGRSVVGGALHASRPPPPPQPKPQQSVKSDDRKLPRQFDIGARMPGDDPTFTVRVPQARV